MSGHSKWATTKHKKAVVDAKRSKMYTKLIKNIEVAARMGGGDPTGNPTLFDAIQKAKKSSVTKDNIDRAVQRGSGAETGGADYQTIMYEGYGPSGVAMLIECLTDNKNRAAMEVRTAMTRNGGSLADPGLGLASSSTARASCSSRGAGGQRGHRGRRPRGHPRRRRRRGQGPRRAVEVVSEATDLVAVRTALQAAGIDYDSAEASVRARRRRSRSTPTRPASFPPRRRARGPRRRAEHLRQLRRPRRRHGGARGRRRLTAPRPARVSARPARPGAASVASEHLFGPTEARRVRVLGIDPGLTRCGMGVVEGDVGRPLRLVDVNVLRTSLDAAGPASGWSRIEKGIEAWIEEHRPDAVAIERVFARSDVSTVMGTAQASGIAMVVRRAPRPAGRAAHPQRGQGRGLRQRPRRQGPGRRHGHPHPAPRRHAQARRRRRRAGAGHHPHLARWRPGPHRRRAGRGRAGGRP